MTEEDKVDFDNNNFVDFVRRKFYLIKLEVIVI